MSDPTPRRLTADMERCLRDPAWEPMNPRKAVLLFQVSQDCA